MEASIQKSCDFCYTHVALLSEDSVVAPAWQGNERDDLEWTMIPFGMPARLGPAPFLWLR